MSPWWRSYPTLPSSLGCMTSSQQQPPELTAKGYSALPFPSGVGQVADLSSSFKQQAVRRDAAHLSPWLSAQERSYCLCICRQCNCSRDIAIAVCVQSQPGKAEQRWERFFCGLAAGMMAKLGTHPLDVAKKRFQVSHSATTSQGLSECEAWSSQGKADTQTC